MNRVINICMVVLVGLAIVAGCRRQVPDSAAAQGASPADAADTLRSIRQWYQAGQYRLIEPYVVAERRTQLVDTLMAVDQVLSASRRLQKLVSDQLGVDIAQAWDLSHLQYSIGPFSRDVKVIRSQQQGGRATVVIQVAQRIPLLDVQFVRDQAGLWQYAPDDPVTGLPDGLRQLARSLNDLADELAKTRLTRQQFKQRFDRQVLPRIDALGELSDTAMPVGPD